MRCNANTERLAGYKIKLYPTEAQKELLQNYINFYRYVYNWTIETEISNKDSDGKFIKQIGMFNKFAELRRSKDKEWLNVLPLNSGRYAIIDAIQAFKNFFEKRANFPNFKTKRKSKKEFKVRGDRLYFKGDYVRIEGFPYGELILCKKHEIPKNRNAKYYDCRITYDGYSYWLSLSMERYFPIQIEPQEEAIGIDLGLRKLATLSDGTVYKNPDVRKLNKRINRLQKRVSRDQEKIGLLNKNKSDLENEAIAKLNDTRISKNMIKRKEALHKAELRRKNIRQTYTHTITKEIVERHPKAIVMETLDIEEMVKNKYMAKIVGNVSLYGFRKQMEYKCKERNIPFILADPWYPSTKTCSRCGHRTDIGRSEIYKCPYCGLVIDRDINAAINLKHLATV